ncbi:MULTISPECIES: LacI family DNA-binding transcriptional regulator [Cohaesibacter]|uniref:LacI family DNA-binding transcriptional regulator n=1 Tax=Cohaesibacter TaxID=655352 RepID=UPI001485C0D5|nr:MULTISPECIES: LacI family DNA-binding transcriptional regulator [Cohaesibacter]
MTKGNIRPTQKTIAEMTGLAVTTVSRALQGDPKIAEATRREVARVASEIGYVPDRAAQRLRTGKTRVITLVLNPWDEMLDFGSSMITGLSQSLRGTDYHLTITPTFTEDDDMEPIRRLVQNNLADAIVLTRTRNFDERIRYLLEKDFPFISHGRTDFSQAHNFVDFDNEAFAYRAATRLANKGCKKIAIILPRDQFTLHQHLRYGFMKAVSERGMDYVIPENLSLESSVTDMRGWVDSYFGPNGPNDIDGFVCLGEGSYLAVHSGLRELGRQRGVDYHAVVKTNSVILEQIHPGLERFSEDIREAGELMGRAMLAQLRGETSGVQQIIQTPQAVFTETDGS